MSETLIVVPLDPPAACSANTRVGWRRRAEATRMMRTAAGWAALPYADELWRDDGAPVVIQAEIGWSKGRRWQDRTNLPHLLKPIIDGIADVLWSGRDDHVRLGDVTQDRDPDGRGYVRVWLRVEEEPASTRSSGNPFADLGLPDAEARLAKARVRERDDAGVDSPASVTYG